MKKSITLLMLIFSVTLSLKAPPFFSREEILSNALSWQEQTRQERKRTARIDAILLTLRTIESGGNYEQKGKSGEYGAYQWMPESFEQFSYRYYGELLDITLPENQDKVARRKVEELVDAGYSDEAVAAIWNSGSHLGWENKKGRNKHGVVYDVPKYVNKFILTLNKIET